MRKTLSLFFTLILCLSLAACGGKSGWQEQYDLGTKYLTDGNYEEAILAFTAAIEIDPKQALAYVGRGDAYVAGIDLDTELSGDAWDAYDRAAADYLAALDLDETLDDVYYKAAEVCLALGDTEAARDILRRGYDATGDEEMLTWAEELDGNGQERSETVTLTGVVIRNVDYYGAQWERYRDTYQTSPTAVCTMDTYGVRFPQPVTVTLGDETVTIAEAGIEAGISGENYDDINQLAGQNVSLTGYFYRNVETEELNTIQGDDGPSYNYRPNGDYIFYLTAWEIG